MNYHKYSHLAYLKAVILLIFPAMYVSFNLKRLNSELCCYILIRFVLSNSNFYIVAFIMPIHKMSLKWRIVHKSLQYNHHCGLEVVQSKSCFLGNAFRYLVSHIRQHIVMWCILYAMYSYNILDLKQLLTRKKKSN